MPNSNDEQLTSEAPDHGEEPHDQRADYDDNFGQPLAASRKVIFPGVGLLVASYAYAVGWLLSLVASVIVAIYAQPDSYESDTFPGWSLLSFGGMIYAGLMLYGTYCLLRLRSWLWALFAAFLAVVPMVGAGFYGIMSGPLGVWALIVLFQPDVREEFRRRRTERSQAEAKT